MVQQYACGYLIDDDRRVVLIRKNRPTWQAGRLNGVGGHVEPGETPLSAMVREFTEETGVTVTGWHHFATISWSDGVTFFYRSLTDGAALDRVRTTTDEAVEIHRVDALGGEQTVPSLAFLLPLALYPRPLAAPVLIREAA